MNGWTYFGRSLGFVGLGSLSPPFDSSSFFGNNCLNYGINLIDSCSVLQCPGYLVNYMIPSF